MERPTVTIEPIHTMSLIVYANLSDHITRAQEKVIKYERKLEILTSSAPFVKPRPPRSLARTPESPGKSGKCHIHTESILLGRRRNRHCDRKCVRCVHNYIAQCILPVSTIPTHRGLAGGAHIVVVVDAQRRDSVSIF